MKDLDFNSPSNFASSVTEFLDQKREEAIDAERERLTNGEPSGENEDGTD